MPDIREQVSHLLIRRADVVIADSSAMFSHTGRELLDREYCARLGEALVRLLAAAIRDGAVDADDALIATLRAVLLERSVAVEQLFAFAYLNERAALDELALDRALGATSEPWPLVAQLVRRGSFDYLASFVGRTRREPTGADVADRLTGLTARAVFDAVIAKETERSGRFGYALALILFDVDHLGALNERLGFNVGSRLLERIAILLRAHFRQHDWVVRYGDDEIAVMLTASDAEHARALADRARVMIEDRLSLTDRHSGSIVPVTVSAGVVNVAGAPNAVVDPERLLIEAESAVKRAKRAGRNRVEAAAVAGVSRALPRSSPSI